MSETPRASELFLKRMRRSGGDRENEKYFHFVVKTPVKSGPTCNDSATKILRITIITSLWPKNWQVLIRMAQVYSKTRNNL